MSKRGSRVNTQANLVEMAISFPMWKEVLLADVRLQSNKTMRDRVAALSDHVLHGLWWQGAKPSVRGILDHCTVDWDQEEA